MILLGWGLCVIALVRRIGGTTFGGVLSAFQTVWLGYAGLLAFIQLASLVAPINTGVLVASLPPALAGYFVHRRAIARRLRGLARRPRQLAVVIVIVIATAIVTDYVACDLVRWYDTGLYHLQAVKWNANYGVVRGLANLHTRFGYNNSVHVFAAYLDACWEAVAAHLTCGLILLIALAQWFTEIFLSRSPRQRVRQVFCLLSLPFLLTKLWTLEPSSLSSDLPASVFAAVLVLELLSLVPDSRDRSLLPLAYVLAIGAVALTTKLGGLSLCCVPLAIAIYRVRHAAWRVRVAVGLLPVMLVLGWLVRGVIESGWILYPVAGRLPVSWAVPERIAAVDLGNIQSWSRMSGKPPEEVFGQGVWHWLAPWLDAFRQSHEFILLVVALALLAWRVAVEPARPGIRRLCEWSAVAACILGIAQWFAGAPDLRYGGFLFWLLPAAVLAPMLANTMRDAMLRIFVVGISLVACIWGGGFAFRVNATLPRLWGRPALPQRVQTTSVTTAGGLTVHVPATGDQCFDADLPCSPQVDTVAPRVPGDLGAGFLPTP